jgi:hypothetical protein
MYSVLGVPDDLQGDARNAYIEKRLLGEIQGIGKINSLKIRGE